MYFLGVRHYYQYPESWRMTSLKLHPCPACFSVNELPRGSVSLLAVFPRVTKGELFCSAYQTLFNLSVRTQPFISQLLVGKAHLTPSPWGHSLRSKQTCCSMHTTLHKVTVRTACVLILTQDKGHLKCHRAVFWWEVKVILVHFSNARLKAVVDVYISIWHANWF